MTKRILSIIITVLMVISSVSVISVSASTPTEISTAAQFLQIATAPDGNYKLVSDIDLTGVTVNGTLIPAFSGTLDGAKHRITGLNITTDSAEIGIIGKNTGTVKNLAISGSITVNLTNEAVIGTVAAFNSGTVSGCLSNVSITATSTKSLYIGGIVGQNKIVSKQGRVTLCNNQANITVSNPAELVGTTVCAGGICAAYGNVEKSENHGDIDIRCANIFEGYGAGIGAFETNVKNCVNLAKINVCTGFRAYAGGLSSYIGSGLLAYVLESKNEGDINADVEKKYFGDHLSDNDYYAVAGGIAAYMANVTVADTEVDEGNCFSFVRNSENKGKVSANLNNSTDAYAGGIAGMVNGVVNNCINFNKDISAKKSGPIFAALNSSNILRGKVRDCYYAESDNLYNTIVGAQGTVAQTVAVSTDGFKNTSTFVGFDFTNIWAHDGNQPYVRLPQTHEHIFENYVSDGNATCIADGTKTAICTVEGCGKTDTVEDVGSKLSTHTWGEYVSDNNATCVTDGTKTATCTVEGCGKTDTVKDVGSKLSTHTWGEYVSDNNATCVTDGTKTATCTVEGCGKTDTVKDVGSKHNNHTFGDYVYNNDATCVTDGTKTATCTVEGCGKTDTVKADGTKHNNHTFGDYVYNNDADYGVDGTKTAKCTVEGCSETDTVNAEGTALEWLDSSKIFEDVNEGAWFKGAIDYAVTKGMMNGTTATTMKPNNNVTRAQFVQILANIEGVDTTDRNVSTKFQDVKSGQWFAPAIKWANDNKIVEGTSATTFNPNGTLTRENMCLMIVRYIEEYKDLTIDQWMKEEKFEDEATIGKWAIEAVKKCQRAGLVFGIGKDFKPKNTATRAQIATIMMRVDQIFKVVK